MNPLLQKVTGNFAYYDSILFLETVKLTDNYNIYSRIGTIFQLILLIFLSFYTP